MTYEVEGSAGAVNNPSSNRRHRSSHVYFVGAIGGPIKIGCSIRPPERRTSLQVGSERNLILLASIPGGPALERALHSRFALHRIRGEMFAATPELLMLVWEAAAGGMPNFSEPGLESAVARFAHERIVRDPNQRTKSSVLYAAFSLWCEDTAERACSQKSFSVALQALGYVSKRSDGMHWVGLRLRASLDG